MKLIQALVSQLLLYTYQLQTVGRNRNFIRTRKLLVNDARVLTVHNCDDLSFAKNDIP